MPRKVVFFLGLVFIVAFRGDAQGDPCLRRTIAVSVLDKSGEPVTGLTAADFRAEFRGKPVKILSVGTRSRPLRVVVFLDNSKSMHSAAAIWKMALEAVRHVYASAPPDFQLALLVFSEELEEKFDFGENQKVLDAFLPNAVERKGPRKTRLRDSLVSALESMPALEPADVVYAVTDGSDSFSRASISTLETKLLQRGLRLFVFLTIRRDEGRTYSLQELAGPGELMDLVKSTGGGEFPVRTLPEERTEAAKKLYRRMGEFHELELELPVPVDKKRGWKLHFVRADLSGDPHLAYPERLMPCSESGKLPR